MNERATDSNRTEPNWTMPNQTKPNKTISPSESIEFFERFEWCLFYYFVFFFCTVFIKIFCDAMRAVWFFAPYEAITKQKLSQWKLEAKKNPSNPIQSIYRLSQWQRIAMETETKASERMALQMKYKHQQTINLRLRCYFLLEDDDMHAIHCCNFVHGHIWFALQRKCIEHCVWLSFQSHALINLVCTLKMYARTCKNY